MAATVSEQKLISRKNMNNFGLLIDNNDYQGCVLKLKRLDMPMQVVLPNEKYFVSYPDASSDNDFIDDDDHQGN